MLTKVGYHLHNMYKGYLHKPGGILKLPPNLVLPPPPIQIRPHTSHMKPL